MNSDLETMKVVHFSNRHNGSQFPPDVRLGDGQLIIPRTLTMPRNIIGLDLFALGAPKVLLSRPMFQFVDPFHECEFDHRTVIFAATVGTRPPRVNIFVVR